MGTDGRDSRQSPKLRCTRPESESTQKELTKTTRLDYLLIYRTRLWKKPRLSIKELYGSILALSEAHKLGLGTFTWLSQIFHN